MDNNSLPGKSLGQWMVYLAWIIFLVILTLVFKDYLDRKNNPNQNIAISYSVDADPIVTLIQNRQGHYLATGMINSDPVTFLLDTGATLISIPQNIAHRLRLKKGFATQSMTANGTITVFNTVLKSVSIGAITLKNIKGTINPYMQGDEILLGMSFMKHLDMSQSNGQLTLKHPQKN